MFFFFFFNDTATTEIYTLSLHDALPISRERRVPFLGICFGMQMAVIEAARNLVGLRDASSTEFGPCKEPVVGLLTEDRKSTRLNSSHANISYAVFCLKKKTQQ